MQKGMIAKTYNRAGVYNGGWAATFCLDVMIQEETHGARDIDDLFRLLLDQFGLHDKRYTSVDLAFAASEVAGDDLSDFFRTHIAGTDPLPVKDCLRRAGFNAQILNYAGEAFIAPNNSATAAQKRVQHHLLEGTPAIGKSR